MPEREDLDVQSHASELLTEARNQRNDDGGHESSLFDVERYFNQPTADDVSGSHRTKASLEALSDCRVQYTTVP
jgi:hypothetical protein